MKLRLQAPFFSVLLEISPRLLIAICPGHLPGDQEATVIAPKVASLLISD